MTDFTKNYGKTFDLSKTLGAIDAARRAEEERIKKQADENLFMTLDALRDLLSACTQLEWGIRAGLPDEKIMNLVDTEKEREQARAVLDLLGRGEREQTTFLQTDEDCGYWECTACDDILMWESDDIPPKDDIIFCPFCGAKIHGWVMYKDRFEGRSTSNE